MAVRVYNGRLASVVQDDGRGFVEDVARQIESTAKVLAPKRTGRLARSISIGPTRGSNQYQVRYRVTAYAPYSLYVHEGTGIYGPKRKIIDIGKGMGPLPPPYPKWIRYSQGQRSQQFLENAAQLVLARRGF